MDTTHGTRPLWFWNDRPTKQGIKEIMENCAEKDGYAGFGILPYNACGLKYMSQEYLDTYQTVLEEAKRLKLKICLYDEWWFPSGGAGGILKEKYPEACAKRLDMEEYSSSDRRFEFELPNCVKVMATVAFDGTNAIDLEDYVSGNVLRWTAPKDGYKILCFVLRDADLGRVDYLDTDSVKKFISCTHDVYYDRFSEFFGDVIDSAFYDEPQFYSAGGRAWTEKFNEKFIEKYGESPAIYYPALFYDIGNGTAYARNAMFSLRAELYAEGFPKVIQDWCTEHGISLTGHVDQEEAENPCGITGDLMTSFKYQDIPGVDEIFREGRASAAYKIVSSSAVNFNKKLVMCECFGAIDGITKEAIYRESYDLFTKGINFLVPHAVWYDPSEEKVKFKPELSYRNGYYGKFLHEYNEFCAAVQNSLQNGGQVNTTAMLYPIESLRCAYSFSWDGDPVSGGPTSENNCYMRLGQYLVRECNFDFTFLHPDVLLNDCEIGNGKITIKDSVHYQSYGVVIIPGMTAMSIKTARMLEKFVRCGGTLISVANMPTVAVDGESKELNKLFCDMFGKPDGDATFTDYGMGKCVFLPYSKREMISDILKNADADTTVLNKTPGLQYIHKRNEECDVWYFAAILKPADTDVSLRGTYDLTLTDPKTGKTVAAKSCHSGGSTAFRLTLDKESSVIIKGYKISNED